MDDIDASIARILGYVVIWDSELQKFKLRDLKNNHYIDLPRYSFDITVLYPVMQSYKDAGVTFIINEEGGLFEVKISHPQLHGITFTQSDDSLPKAICLAIIQFNQLFKLSKK